MITESLVLGAFGGAAGVLLARLGVPLLLSLVPIALPRWLDFSIDGRVLAFAVLVSIVTSVVFGTIPALGLSRTAVVETLKSAGRGLSTGRPQRRLRNLVVIAELALSMTLLAGDKETSDRYGVAAIPHTVVIDRAGNVRRVFRGGTMDLEREVTALLK